jgi:hypothetical protein
MTHHNQNKELTTWFLTKAAGDNLMRNYVLWLDAVVHTELEKGCYAEVATRRHACARWRTSRRARRRMSGRLILGFDAANGEVLHSLVSERSAPGIAAAQRQWQR